MSDESSPPGGKRKILFGLTAGIAASVSVILSNIYSVEGGYVNDRHDPGGETNMGVTKATARASGWRGTMLAFPKQCFTAQDICADRIYYEKFIELPGYVPVIQSDPAIGEELVNTAVNTGYVYENKWFQKSLNDNCPSLPGLQPLTPDGHLGSGTMTYYAACRTKLTPQVFCVHMLDSLDGYQKQYYISISIKNPNNKRYLKGWLANRIGNVDRTKCLNAG
jgi:lysozyme family protein